MTCKHLLNGIEDCVFCQRDQLRQELSLAEEGLANYQQELQRIRQESLSWARSCECACYACEKLSSVIRSSVPQTEPQTDT
jgi:hypothetical protein